MNYFLGLGINDYPGSANDLNGCIKDINRIVSKLESMEVDFTGETLFDSEVTANNVESKIREIYGLHAENYEIGNEDNYLIFYYSGHGTQIVGSESDGYSEAFYWYDGPYADYELHELFEECPDGLKIIFFMDSCFSGGMFGIKLFFSKLFTSKKVKFLEYESIPEGMPKFISSIKGGMDNVLVYSGCGEDEYSYENDEGGVFTTALIEVISLIKSNNEICEDINNAIDKSNYPQNPELFSDNETFKSQVFLSNVEIEEEDEDDITDDTEETESSSISWHWWLVLGIAIVIAILSFIVK